MKHKSASILLCFLICLGCARKPLYTCGLEYYTSFPNVKSYILSFKRVAIADTTISFLSGKITGKDSTDKGIFIDTNMIATVVAIDVKTGKAFGKLSDENGEYQLRLPASVYDIRVQALTYSTLILKKIFLGTGDVVEFNVRLGQQHQKQDSSVIIMQTFIKNK